MFARGGALIASWALGPRCNAMGNEIERRIRELKELTVGQLRARYEALTGEGSRSSNRRHDIQAQAPDLDVCDTSRHARCQHYREEKYDSGLP